MRAGLPAFPAAQRLDAAAADAGDAPGGGDHVRALDPAAAALHAAPPGVQAEYGHRTAVRAIARLLRRAARRPRALPGGDARVRCSACTEAAGDGERYFLDKTPRYHLVVDEIMELFPDAKFIFLWRHPLAMAASVIDRSARGQLEPRPLRVDLSAASTTSSPPSGPATRAACHCATRTWWPTRRPSSTADLRRSWGSPARRGGRASPRSTWRAGWATAPDASSTTGRPSSSTTWRETMRNPLRKRWCRRVPAIRGARPPRPRWATTRPRCERELSSIRTGGALLASDAARRPYGTPTGDAVEPERSAGTGYGRLALAPEASVGRMTETAPSSSCISARPPGRRCARC